jgi:hypothetical protein
MATDDDFRLIRPISVWQFELHALSLDRGPNFEPSAIFTAYQGGPRKRLWVHSIRQSPRGEVPLDRNRDVFGLNEPPSNEPPGMPSVWSSLDCGRASMPSREWLEFDWRSLRVSQPK